MNYRGILLSTVAALVGVTPTLASGPSFKPDVTFQGSSLDGWHALGQAKWHAENGEVVGTPQSSDGGWLILGKSYQDVGLYAEFRCTGGCETGALFRMEKTAEGWKGIYVSLTEPQTPSYSVTLDGEGKILKRDKLPKGGGLVRVWPPPDTPAFHFVPPPQYDVKLPYKRPDTSLRPNDWNEIEFMFDANIVRANLNNGAQNGGVATNDGWGPLALYVGGSGEVHFRNLGYKDLGLKETPQEVTSADFRKQQISDFYYSMFADVADFNRDGALDIVAGSYIYYGPDFTKRREIDLAVSTDPSTSFNDWWGEYAADFTGDGWPDVIRITFAANNGVFLYVNPKGENRRWDMHKVVSDVQSEIAVLADIDGPGKPAIVYMGNSYVNYAEPDPANPTGPWIVHRVSQQGYGVAHGLGVGDIAGHGRLDIVNMYGWWEHPADGSDQPWKYHPADFGRYSPSAGGALMGVYDVNGDGLNDVVTALSAHGWGLAWFEQKRDSQGNISFIRHMISDDLNTPKENAGAVAFSEPHGANFVDMNGDGIPDFVAGKRYWTHNADYVDPDPFGPPLLYWYETVRDPKAPGGARFEPHFIDNNSGVGSNVLAVDLNKDGAMDVVTSNKLGTFIFWGKPKPGGGHGTSR
jgi:hypothetical protein